jgi:hypothetical protein
VAIASTQGVATNVDSDEIEAGGSQRIAVNPTIGAANITLAIAVQPYMDGTACHHDARPTGDGP